jgi:hypothetical protein
MKTPTFRLGTNTNNQEKITKGESILGLLLAKVSDSIQSISHRNKHPNAKV